MKLFFEYLKYKRKIIFIFFLFAAVFAITFFLCRIPVAAVIYPALLCIVFSIFFIIADFLKIRKKFKMLEKAKNLGAEMINSLPEPASINEKQLNETVEALVREVIEIKANYQEEYTETVDYFTVWAHQIKTPISSMKLMLNCEDSSLSRRLKTELFRTQQYVDMVLAFLRLGSESTDYVFREYDLDSIIKPCVRNFASDFIERKLSLDYNAINLRVITDEKWIAFVIEQLLTNALKYTQNGEIKIYCDNNNNLFIEDTGIGIAPEDLPRIFEKGFTGCNGRTQQNSSGLGLYLCKRICENIGVGIEIHSEVGKGTCVKLSFSKQKLIFD